MSRFILSLGFEEYSELVRSLRSVLATYNVHLGNLKKREACEVVLWGEALPETLEEICFLERDKQREIDAALETEQRQEEEDRAERKAQERREAEERERLEKEEKDGVHAEPHWSEEKAQELIRLFGQPNSEPQRSYGTLSSRELNRNHRSSSKQDQSETMDQSTEVLEMTVRREGNRPDYTRSGNRIRSPCTRY